MDAVDLQKSIENQEHQSERLKKFIQKSIHYQNLDLLRLDVLGNMISAIYVSDWINLLVNVSKKSKSIMKVQVLFR